MSRCQSTQGSDIEETAHTYHTTLHDLGEFGQKNVHIEISIMF